MGVNSHHIFPVRAVRVVRGYRLFLRKAALAGYVLTDQERDTDMDRIASSRLALAALLAGVSIACTGCPPLMPFTVCDAYVDQCHKLEQRLKAQSPNQPLSEEGFQRLCTAYQALLYIDPEVADKAWRLRGGVPRLRSYGVAIGRWNARHAVVNVTRLCVEKRRWDVLFGLLREASRADLVPDADFDALANALGTAAACGAPTEDVAREARGLSAEFDKQVKRGLARLVTPLEQQRYLTSYVSPIRQRLNELAR